MGNPTAKGSKVCDDARQEHDDRKEHIHPDSVGEKRMTCAEFQKVLPYIFDGGGSTEEQQHLATCHICSDLVADLRYIADAAKLLVPMEDPSPRVWDGIQESLERESMVKRARKHV
jgi:hypothetical protein